MKTFDTLYKRTKTGAIQYYTVSVEVHPNKTATIVKESGQLGTTSPVIHREHLTTGVNIGRANETTPKQQAILQASSDWKKKQDSGYKTLEQLDITQANGAYCWNRILGDNRAEVPFYGTLPACLEAALPEFNSDASGNVLPQLAPSKLWAPSPKNVYPAQWELKYDGNRTFLNMELDRTHATTRTGKPHTQLQHLCDILDMIFPIAQRTERVILDGEVYLHGLGLEELRTALTKGNEFTKLLKFVLYDMPLHVTMDQEFRTKLTEQVWRHIRSSFFDFSIPTVVHSDDEVRTLTDQAEEDGYEGGMVKNLQGLYRQGQRNPDWKKVKTREDHEYTVVGFRTGQRGAQDLKFVCKIEDGSTFEVTMNGSVQVKEAIFAEIESYIGKQLTVSHKGFTAYGIPNHAKGKAFREEGT